MNSIISLLKHEINELIAIIITSGDYEKNFYEGKLIDLNDEYIILEVTYKQFIKFKYEHFILATPLNRYH